MVRFLTMANLHRTREAIVLAYFNDVIDDTEFVLLYDANRQDLICGTKVKQSTHAGLHWY